MASSAQARILAKFKLAAAKHEDQIDKNVIDAIKILLRDCFHQNGSLVNVVIQYLTEDYRLLLEFYYPAYCQQYKEYKDIHGDRDYQAIFRRIDERESNGTGDMFKYAKHGDLQSLVISDAVDSDDEMDDLIPNLTTVDYSGYTVLDWAHMKGHQAMADETYSRMVRVAREEKRSFTIQKKLKLHTAILAYQPVTVIDEIIREQENFVLDSVGDKSDSSAELDDQFPIASVDDFVNHHFGDDRLTPLQVAASKDQLLTVQKLVEYKARMTDVDGLQNHLIHHASRASVELVAYLFQLQPTLSVFVPGHLHCYPIHVAACSNNVELMELIAGKSKKELAVYWAVQLTFDYQKDVDVSIKVVDMTIDVQDADGETALYKAVVHERVAAVRWLLQHGADPNPNPNPPKIDTPLERAIAVGNEEIVELLLEYKAAAHFPLHIAARNGHVSIARILIEHQINVNSVDNLNQTPLFDAVLKGKRAMINYLLENKADPEIRDRNGNTPLLLACTTEPFDDEIFSLLLRAGANLLVVNNKGQNVPYVANISLNITSQRKLFNFIVKSPYVAEMSRLINIPNTEGVTVFQRMVFKSTTPNLEWLKIFLQYGADVTVRDNKKSTVLHYLVNPRNFSAHETIAMCHWVLACGADINAQNNQGDTPLHIILERYKEFSPDHLKAMLRYFILRGANLNLTNKDGLTVLDLATRNLGRTSGRVKMLRNGVTLKAPAELSEVKRPNLQSQASTRLSSVSPPALPVSSRTFSATPLRVSLLSFLRHSAREIATPELTSQTNSPRFGLDSGTDF